MPVSRMLQESFASGELDPLLWSRETVSMFYLSARLIENAIPLPQGGAKRREGWRHRSLQRGRFNSIALGGATATAPNGGTAANAIDGSASTRLTTTTNVGTSTAYVVVRIDLGSSQRVSTFDVNDFGFSGLTGQESGAASLQSSTDDAVWTTRATINIGGSAYNRRFAMPPNQDLATARYWRIIIDNPTAANFSTSKVTLSYVDLRYENGYSSGAPSLGNFSEHRLTASIDDEYILIATQRNCDIYRADTGAWVAAVYLDHAEDEVASIKSSTSLDTLILYHNDVAPSFVQRLGSDGDWRSGFITFDSVVEFPFDDATTGGVNEKQYIRADGMNGGEKVTVEYNGDISNQITWSTSAATNAASIEAALEALSGIGDLEVVVDGGSDENAELEIRFNGADTQKKPWPLIVIKIQVGDGILEISRSRTGRADWDYLWSATRGYPSCGTFYQGRHWMGGFRSRPDVVAGSRAGSLFDFREDNDPADDSPIVIVPGIDDQVTVQNIYPGRHLQIFTSSAELYIPDEPIVPAPAVKVTSRHGTYSQTTPVDIQGATIFVGRSGDAVREYLFTDTEQSYSAEPVSLLAGHLVSQPASLALRRQTRVDEPALLLIANTGTGRDGQPVPPAMVAIDRVQQVTGFCRVTTLHGDVLAFEASQGGDGFVMVQRDLAGTTWNHLEQMDRNAMSDASIEITGSGSTIDLSDYPWLEGIEVYVHLDGIPSGSYTVTGGAIDLGTRSFTASAEVGLRMVPRIIMHPFKGQGQVSPTMQRQRIFRALLQLDRTSAVSVGINGRTLRKVALHGTDGVMLDMTAEELLFTGAKRISGIGGWEAEPCLEITQDEPAPFILRSVTYDVHVGG